MPSTNCQIRAFRMQLHEGQAEEYRRRHNALWPELHTLLKEAGIEDYSIHLDPETGALYGRLCCPQDFDDQALKHHPVMRRWWDFMADIMETHEDNAPVVHPLESMFYMA